MDNTDPNLAERCINTIRFLAADAIQKANSGHPGLPMGAAPMGYVLWNDFLKFNPKNPGWFNRDRFILSAGHGSMLQYALLHLTGFEGLSMESIQSFRQLGASTPGHPENTVTQGIEVTTGPLGQGIANAVGMAIAERHLAARFNKPGLDIVDHYTYVVAGDGCQMEGISSEACSLAGHLGLGKLIMLYDDNKISIEGPTDIAFTENVAARFEAYGWQVLEVKDGNSDLYGIADALEKARAETQRPTIISVRTTIGYGAPHRAGTADCHGSPLGDDELQAAREGLGYEEPPFSIAEDVLQHMRKAVDRGAQAESEWSGLLEQYRKEYPTEATEFEEMLSGTIPSDWEQKLPVYSSKNSPAATRALSGESLNAAAEALPRLIGGSADLAPSNKTMLKSTGVMQKNAYENRNIHFGVREHAMGAICNGMALHGSGLIPYCGTFLVFTDYMRGAIRVSALSGAGVIYIMTHDSVAVGEDGPTHQPVEHLASLRAMPNLIVLRPADGNETAGAYKVAVNTRNRPTLLSLSRQKLPHLDGTSADAVSKGAYVVSDSDDEPELILIGTGSEVSLCVEAAAKLRQEGRRVRVVSMPSFELFAEQDEAYRESVLPTGVTKRLAVEAGTSFGWERYVGTKGTTISIDRFGTSAPGAVCLEKFGFTVETVLEKAMKLLTS